MADTSADQDEPVYKIGDLAQEFEVTLRTLRFYEDKGLLKPTRVGVTRLFTRRDRARLKLIMLGKRVGFSLTEVKRMIDLYDPRGKNVTQLKVALDKGEAQMRVLEEQRDSIHTAIEELERTIAMVRNMLEDSA
ncbi:MerR family DNA-binding transcriptional regulator [Hoeflea sp. G2-23]|uniref:MerR family DNA-binding transcriptional regulator n=1 Tax=Hoeflea algicola TaxID=2983763 RepID=A0ABT3ZDC7_9HYPH|nr:MerR family DNA-binding transcriptional regulator [Hoeflea algicola]MCY0149788.1 MerR family DNA-binding transcriptional regulator [Hoeflea algicola]